MHINSSRAAHVRDLEHALSILLHEINFVRVTAINRLHLVADIITLRVVVLIMGRGGNVASGLSVTVRGEDLRERVAHLQLAVERSVEGRLLRIKTAILASALDSGRSVIVDQITQGSHLKVGRLLGVR